MSKRKSAGSRGASSGPHPADARYELGQWAEGEGADLTNPHAWESEVGPRLGEDISAGQGHDLTSGKKINDVAVPSAEDPRYHIDFKVQQSDPKPKTTLQPDNVSAKILLMKALRDLVPVLILNPMGLRPAVRRDNPSIKGLWLRYRVAFLADGDNGMSERVRWKEIVLEGVMSLLQLTDAFLDNLRDVLDAEAAGVDRAVLRRRIGEVEVRLILQMSNDFAKYSPEAKIIGVGDMINKVEPDARKQLLQSALTEAEPELCKQVIQDALSEVEPEVRKQVIQTALTEAEPEVRQGVLATCSIADLEAELARRKAAPDSSSK